MGVLSHCAFNVDFPSKFLENIYSFAYAAFISHRILVSIHACRHNSILRQWSLLYKLHCTCDVSQGTQLDQLKDFSFWYFSIEQNWFQARMQKAVIKLCIISCIFLFTILKPLSSTNPVRWEGIYRHEWMWDNSAKLLLQMTSARRNREQTHGELWKVTKYFSNITKPQCLYNYLHCNWRKRQPNYSGVSKCRSVIKAGSKNSLWHSILSLPVHNKPWLALDFLTVYLWFYKAKITNSLHILYTACLKIL